MQILFLDESGTAPRPQDKYPSYFVVGGIIVPETSWHRLRDGLMGMKLRRGIRGEIKWRYFAPGNDGPKNPMRNLSQSQRDETREEIYKLITSEVGIKTLACISSRQASYDLDVINNQDDIYHATYKPVTERFQYYLQDLSKLTGRKEFGMIVTDHRGPQDDKRLRSHHERLIHSSSKSTAKYENLIEGLFVHPSNLSIGIQLADMVAGAVWRKYEKGDDRYYNMLSPSLRKSSDGKIDGYGIVKFPTKGFI